jgi:hypothetical protein
MSALRKKGRVKTGGAIYRPPASAGLNSFEAAAAAEQKG